MTSLCLFHLENGQGFFVVLPFGGRELVRNFGGEDGTKSLRIFGKPLAINGFGIPLPTTVWVGLAMLFPSA